MTAMALDPAGGGDDPAALAMRHGPWFAPLVTLKGEATRDGAQMAAQVLVHRRANAALVVDMGGGLRHRCDVAAEGERHRLRAVQRRQQVERRVDGRAASSTTRVPRRGGGSARS